jgi:hypothetical protein
MRPHYWVDRRVEGRVCAACAIRHEWPGARRSCPMSGDEWAYPEHRPPQRKDRPLNAGKSRLGTVDLRMRE